MAGAKCRGAVRHMRRHALGGFRRDDFVWGTISPDIASNHMVDGIITDRGDASGKQPVDPVQPQHQPRPKLRGERTAFSMATHNSHGVLRNTDMYCQDALSNGRLCQSP